MKKNLLLSILFLLLFNACSQEPTKILKISTNSWIGYAPLFYAREKGYLDKIGIELLTNVSLAEATELYNIGKADMVTTTQHEYYSLKASNPDIVPVILFDRSNGGDMILSNRTIAQLQKAKHIKAYLEIDSINAEVLKEFMQKYHLNDKNIDFINRDQAQIEELKNENSDAILIVTYVPYNIQLKKNGFHEVASTKDKNTLLVIDALCSDKKTLAMHKEKFIELKKIIDNAIDEIKQEKKSSYELIKGYLGNISYEDYINSLTLIEWINRPSQEILDKIQPLGYERKWLLP